MASPRQQRAEPGPAATPQAFSADHATHRTSELVGLWLTPREGMAYTKRPSLGAFWVWCKRQGIVRTASNLIARADLDRALLRKRQPRRPVSARSLANLRRVGGR